MRNAFVCKPYLSKRCHWLPLTRWYSPLRWRKCSRTDPASHLQTQTLINTHTHTHTHQCITIVQRTDPGPELRDAGWQGSARPWRAGCDGRPVSWVSAAPRPDVPSSSPEPPSPASLGAAPASPLAPNPPPAAARTPEPRRTSGHRLQDREDNRSICDPGPLNLS